MTQSIFDRPNHPAWVWFCRLVLLCAVIILPYYSLIPSSSISVSASDKVLHFVAYAIIASLGAAAFPHMRLLYIFLVTATLGAVLEFAQAMISTGRTASLADQIANMGGAALVILGWIILTSLRHRRRQNS